jgi:hypothetical protein
MRLMTAALLVASFGAHAEDLLFRVEAFQAVQREVFRRPSIEQEPIVRAAFRRHLANAYEADELARASEAELALLLHAADAMGFYSQAPQELELVRRVLQRMEQRGTATNEERAILFRGLVELRRFGDASQFRALHPSLEVDSIPRIIDGMDSTNGPVVYEVAADEFALIKQRRSLGKGIHLIVIAHPLCSYSRDAMQTLAADPTFATILQSHTTWVAPISRWLYFNELQAWNRENPAVQVVLAERREDWPFMRNWSTPVFYVMKDGVWIGSLEGWPDAESRRPQLLALLRAAGLRVE